MNYTINNRECLELLTNTNEVILQALNTISNNTGQTYYDERRDYSGIIERWEFFNITNLEELELLLVANRREFIRFCYLMSKNLTGITDKSIGLYYFQHYLASMKRDESHIMRYFNYSETSKIGIFSIFPSDFIDIYDLAKSQEEI